MSSRGGSAEKVAWLRLASWGLGDGGRERLEEEEVDCLVLEVDYRVFFVC